MAIDASVGASSAFSDSTFTLRPGRQHGRDAVLALKVDPPVREHRRGGERAIQPVLPDDRAGLRIQARDDAVVAHHVQLVTNQQR